MPAFYSRYIHWVPLLFGLALLLIGGLLLLDMVHYQPPGAIWAEQATLDESLAHTVTVHRGRVVARDGHPIHVDSAESAQLMATLKSDIPFASSPSSWFGVTSWLGWYEAILGPMACLLGLLTLRQAHRARYFPSFRDWVNYGQPEAPVFALEADHLRLLRPYPFSASQLTGRSTVAATELTAVDACGRHAVLAGNELIFFLHSQRNEVEYFAQRNNLPLVKHTDAWASLAAPLNIANSWYSDYDLAEAVRLEQELTKLDISLWEIQRIRLRLRLWQMVQPWRWEFAVGYDIIYGHDEVLHLTGAGLLPRRRWYWYTMQVVLRQASSSVNQL